MSQIAPPTNTNKKLQLTLIAAPAAGKGSIAKLISQHYQIPTISTGELVRAEIATGSSLGQSIKEIATKGGLLSDDIVITMLAKRLQEPDCNNGFILDGFPRTLPQAEALSKLTDITCAIEFVLPYPVIIQAATGRRNCKQCLLGYNVADIHYKDENVEINMPPLNPKVAGVCDQCGANPLVLQQRDDDTEEIVRSRLNTYDQLTVPVLEYYQKQGKRFTHYIKNGKRDWPQLQPKLDAVLLKK